MRRTADTGPAGDRLGRDHRQAAVTGFCGQGLPYPGFAQDSGFVTSTALAVVVAGGLYVAFRRARTGADRPVGPALGHQRPLQRAVGDQAGSASAATRPAPPCRRCSAW